MLLYLLRRILLAIPVFWALATLVFLLSRLLPGSFAEERILQSEAGFYSKSNEGSRQAAYLQYLKNSGQDLPLFYFSVSANPVPDSIARVFPEARRLQLEQLAFKYGAWSDIAAYDAAVQKYLASYTAVANNSIKADLQALRFSHSLPEIHEVLVSLQAKAPQHTTNDSYKALWQAYERLAQHANQYTFLFPGLQWHGTSNQYHQWVTGLLQGYAGYSYRTSQSAGKMIWEAFSNTFWLLILSMLLTLVLGLLLSMQMARGKMAWLRRISLPSLFVLDSIPMFVLALLLLVLLANPNYLQLFPVYGMGYYAPEDLTYVERASQWLQYMALPITCLVLVNLPYITNQMFGALQTALQANYAQTARAKGLSEINVIRKHALPNALLPIITLTSDFLPALVDGSIIIETVFAIPGTGRLLVESVLARDYPVLVTIVVLVLAVRMLAYTLAEAGYAWADPRIKKQLV